MAEKKVAWKKSGGKSKCKFKQTLYKNDNKMKSTKLYEKQSGQEVRKMWKKGKSSKGKGTKQTLFKKGSKKIGKSGNKKISGPVAW